MGRMADCPCCLPPEDVNRFEFGGYDYIKMDSTTGEIIWVNDHGGNVIDIDSDGTYLYLVGSASIYDGNRVRKVTNYSGERIWSIYPSITSMTSIAVGLNGVVIGGSGPVGTYSPTGTGTGTGTGDGAIQGGKDIQLLDFDTGQVIWARYMDPLGRPLAGSVSDLSIDEDGNIYAAGSTSPYPGDVGLGTKQCLIKFDMDGNIIWSRVSPPTGTNSVYRSVSASRNYVYICGDATSTNTQTIWEISPTDGSKIWRLSIGQQNYVAQLSGGDGVGSNIITVPPGNPGTNTQPAIFRATEGGGPGTGSGSAEFGVVAWSTNLIYRTAGSNDIAATARAMCVDSSDNIYASVRLASFDPAVNWNIFKVNSSGVTQWRKDFGQNKAQIGSPTFPPGQPFRLCAPNDGYLYVGGARLLL